MSGQGARCAICGKAAVEKFKPFCSSRCATLDLGRWLGEGYRVPVVAQDDEEEQTDFKQIDQEE